MNMPMSITITCKQQGSILLEALISILIFSIGILAIIGLQATSIKMSSDAKFRADAAMLANQYLALMWVDAASATNAVGEFDLNEFTSYATGGANFTSWFDSIAAVLPNASATVATATILRCDNNPCPFAPTGVLQTTSTDVAITISWQLPGESAHSYSTSTMISAQKML